MTSSTRWARLDFSKVRDLGAQRRHAMATAAGSISDLLEVFARQSPEAAALVAILQEGVATLFIESGLENAMGDTNTDMYGMVRDCEHGRPVVYVLKWAREHPRLRVNVPLNRRQALDIESRVHAHRAAGHAIKVADLIDLLGVDVYEDVLNETSGREQPELLALLVRALDVAANDRIELFRELIERGVLSAAPDPRPEAG